MSLHESSAHERGISHFRGAMWVVAASVAVKLLFAFGHSDLVDRLAQAVVMAIMGTVVIGGGAYLWGRLTFKVPASGADEPHLASTGTGSSTAAPVAPAPVSRAAFSGAPVHAQAHPRAARRTAAPPTSTAALVTIGSNADAEEPFDERAAYRRAAEEIAGGTQELGLWMQCRVQAGGDTARAELLYAQARVADLKAEHEESVRTVLVQREADRRQQELAAVGEQAARLWEQFQSDKPLTPEDVAVLAASAIRDGRLHWTRPMTQDTVLHLAAAAGLDEVTRRLLQAGASRDARNRRGDRPVDVALRNDMHVVVMALNG